MLVGGEMSLEKRPEKADLYTGKVLLLRKCII